MKYFLNFFNYKKFYFKIDAINPKRTSADTITNIIKAKKISLLVIVNPAHPFEKYWTK